MTYVLAHRRDGQAPQCVELAAAGAGALAASVVASFQEFFKIVEPRGDERPEALTSVESRARRRCRFSICNPRGPA